MSNSEAVGDMDETHGEILAGPFVEVVHPLLDQCSITIRVFLSVLVQVFDFANSTVLTAVHFRIYSELRKLD